MTTKLIGLRLSYKTIKKLEIIAHHNNQSANFVAKNAIIEWLEIFSRTQQQGMIILGKPFLSNLLELIDINELKPLAEITATRKVDLFHFVIGKHLSIKTLNEFIKYAPKILGNKGLMWFDHIEISSEENAVYIKGVHSLGKNWPQFLIYFFNSLMEQSFNMKLNKDNIKHSRKSLYLEYNY